MSITHIYSHPRIHRQYYTTSSRSPLGSINIDEAYSLSCDSSLRARRHGSLHYNENKYHVDAGVLSAKLNALALDRVTYTHFRENDSPEQITTYARDIDRKSRSGLQSSSIVSSSGLARSPPTSPRNTSLPLSGTPHHYPPRSPLVSRKPRSRRISAVGLTPPDSPPSSNVYMHSTRYAVSPTMTRSRNAHTSSSPLFSPTCAIVHSDSTRSTTSPPASLTLYKLAPLSHFNPFVKRARSDSMSSVISIQIPVKEAAVGENKRLKRRWTISGSMTEKNSHLIKF